MHLLRRIPSVFSRAVQRRGVCGFGTTPLLAPSKPFKQASEAVQRLSAQPSNEDKLQLYALYKQATSGKNASPKPGLFDVVGRYKWEAHTKLGDMSQEEAEKRYIALCVNLGAVVDGAPPVTSSQSVAGAGSDASGSTLTVSLGGDTGGVWTEATCRRAADALASALTNPSAFNVVVVTGGARDAFSAAAGAAGSVEPESPAALALFERLAAVAAGPQLLIAAVNGPASGGTAVFAVAFADLVVASHKVTFECPATASTAEAGRPPHWHASSALVQRVGYPRALQLVGLGRKWTAREAAERGLVDDVYEDSELSARVARIAASTEGVAAAKRLLRGPQVSHKA